MISSKEVNEVVYELNLSNLFKTNSTVLLELLEKPNVREFLKLSQIAVNHGSFKRMSSDEMSRFSELIQDPDVSAYLQRVDSSAHTANYISGSILGSIPGAITGAVTGLSLGFSGVAVAALALLGAISVGHLFGELKAKVQGILRSWNNKEILRKNATGINIMQTTSTSGPLDKFISK